MRIRKSKKKYNFNSDCLIITANDRVIPNIFPFCGTLYEILENMQNILKNLRWYKEVIIQGDIPLDKPYQKILFNVLIEEIENG